MTSYSLRRNQRQLVQYFKRYHLDANALELPKEKPPQSTIEILEKFNPRRNATDHRILFEIISRRVNKKDEQFDSDEERQLTKRGKTRVVMRGEQSTVARLNQIFVNGDSDDDSDDQVQRDQVDQDDSID